MNRLNLDISGLTIPEIIDLIRLLLDELMLREMEQAERLKVTSNAEPKSKEYDLGFLNRAGKILTARRKEGGSN